MELVEHVASDVRELVRLELALAKIELGQEVAAVTSSAILGLCAVALGFTGLASLVIALSLAWGPLGAFAAAVLLLACAGICALLGYRRFPKKVMTATALRLKDDGAILKGHLS
jgi:uncharacterized membrane protein YqjE